MSNANTASILRKTSRKTVVLPAATEAAREAGDLPADQSVEITIRRVRANQVLAEVGTPPRLFALARERKPDETPEAFRERVEGSIKDDPEVLNETYQQTERTQRAIVKLGVADPPISEDGADGTITVDDLGPDFAAVYNAIVEWNSLPYSRLEVAGDGTFLDEPVADDPEPHGREVRDNAEPAPGN